MTRLNRQWLLAQVPRGALSTGDFRLVKSPFPDQELAPGEVLLKSLLFRLTPALRNRMKPADDGGRSGSPRPSSIHTGSLIPGWASAEVIKSNESSLPEGTILTAPMGWQDYAVLKPLSLRPKVRLKPNDVSLEQFDSIFGGNALTAYFGLFRVCQPIQGEVLVVSAAAGSTGSVAAQIGKIVGCKVIGIAGGSEKCGWLLNEVGLDHVIDYKSQDVAHALREIAPQGVNMFFDNVGGSILDAVIANMAPLGRIALCGQIASYDDGDNPAPGPRDMMRVIYWRLRLQGFLMADYEAEHDAALADLRRWVNEKKIVSRVEITEGFERLPQAFIRLFKGENFGTALVRAD